jgi:hypothetical protein
VHGRQCMQCVHCGTGTVQAPGAKSCNTSTPAAATAEPAYSVHLEPGTHYVGSADQASAPWGQWVPTGGSGGPQGGHVTVPEQQRLLLLLLLAIGLFRRAGMLAADKLLLQANIKQNAVQLRGQTRLSCTPA